MGTSPFYVNQLLVPYRNICGTRSCIYSFGDTSKKKVAFYFKHCNFNLCVHNYKNLVLKKPVSRTYFGHSPLPPPFYLEGKSKSWLESKFFRGGICKIKKGMEIWCGDRSSWKRGAGTFTIYFFQGLSVLYLEIT